jgi:hypothetical protein
MEESGCRVLNFNLCRAQLSKPFSVEKLYLGHFFRFLATSAVLMQVYACLVPVLEQQAVEEGFTVIHGEELMLDINTGTEKYSLHIFLHVLLKSCF